MIYANQYKFITIIYYSSNKQITATSIITVAGTPIRQFPNAQRDPYMLFLVLL